MRTLYLIRHAKSSWGNPGLRDHDRPLNDRGLHDAPQMARLLAEHDAMPDLLVSSTAKRALTTAFFFAKVFGVEEEDVVREKNIYEAFPQAILRIISLLPDSAQTVVLFGHNPTFTEVANHFAEDDYIENVPTCGIVKITSTATSWMEFSAVNSKVGACFFPKEVL